MTTTLVEPVVPAAIIQALLDGERVCPDCLENERKRRFRWRRSSHTVKFEVDSCPHRQSQLEAVLDAHYVTIYVPWWLAGAYWPEDEPIVCSRCEERIDECAVCGLECLCPANAPANCPAEDEGPFCCFCVPDNAGHSVDDILTLALRGQVITRYRRYGSGWFQPTLLFSA